MLFNSATFVQFFVVVYALYLLLGRRFRAQNVVLLIASYVFYGAWDWRFLSLLWISTIVDFYAGRGIARSTNPGYRKRLLVVSMAANLGILGFFKYFNFFADGAVRLLGLVGLHAGWTTLHIILPVGISFYTFQTMSYTIDIYRREMEPADSLLDFALFVAFFPQLVAGPIERAKALLPQVQCPRFIRPEQVQAGLFLVLWGYFKKVVIADNLAGIADQVFAPELAAHGFDVVLGLLAFTFQIYCDFSGYSDIARGVSKLLGFELMVNFRLPYFARDPSDFWARWHVSLSSWFRDYLYIPLGGNRQGTVRTCLNLMITMLLCGLWHGAAWTFVLWGGYHGVLLVAYRLLQQRGPQPPRPETAVVAAAKTALMFGFTVLGWLLFRAKSLPQAWHLLGAMSLAASPTTHATAYNVAFYAAPLVAIQVWQHRTGDLLAPAKAAGVVRVAVYAFLLIGILVFGVREGVDFIYFQF